MPLSINNFSFSTFLSVDNGKSSGSGFRLSIDGEEYVVTAKHVLFYRDKFLKDLWIKSRTHDGNTAQMYSAQVALTDENVFFFGSLDLALIKLSGSADFFVESVGHDISIAHINDIKRLGDIAIGTSIFLVGFPSSLTVDDFYDVDRPLLRSGIVAGINVNTRTFVIDSMAYYGVSGGPVVRLGSNNNLEIIGIVSRFVPFITEWKNRHEASLIRQDYFNSGYAVCLPLDNILDKLQAV